MGNQHCGKCGAPYQQYSGPWGSITPPPFMPSCYCWNNQTMTTTTIPTDNKTYSNIEIELVLRRIGIDDLDIASIFKELDNVKK